MSDRPVQSINDTLRLPFLGTDNSHNDLSDNLFFDQYFQNLIPQYAMDSDTQTKDQWLVKRPGIKLIPSSNFLTGIVNNALDCTIFDAIAITALYDVFVIAVYDTSNSTIYIIMARPAAGTYVKIGSFAPGGTNIDDYCFLTEYTQAVAGNALPAVCVNYTNKALSASKSYYAASSGGVFTLNSLTEITDTNFPSKQTPALICTGKFVWLNGVIYIATVDGRIWNSTTNGNDITAWENSSGQIGVIAAQAYPDQLIGLARYKHHVVAFGRNSIEFFNDVGDTPCPLASTTQAFIKFGAKSPRVIRNFNDVMYWISYGENGSAGLWMLDGYTPVKLSTSNIDIFLAYTASGGDPNTYNMQVTSINNKPHIMINQQLSQVQGIPSLYASSYPVGSGTVNDTYALGLNDLLSQILVYDIEDKTWWIFTTRAKASLGIICAGTEFSTPAVQTNVNAYAQVLMYNNYGSGARNSQNFLYQWNNVADVNQDEIGDSSDADYPSVPITTMAQMNTLWFDNEKRKRITKAKVIGYFQNNVSDSNTYSMYLFYLKGLQTVDGSAHLTNLQVRGVNFPNSYYRYYFNNLGMGRSWSFALVEKSKLPFKLKALEVDIIQGSH